MGRPARARPPSPARLRFPRRPLPRRRAPCPAADPCSDVAGRAPRGSAAPPAGLCSDLGSGPRSPPRASQPIRQGQGCTRPLCARPARERATRRRPAGAGDPGRLSRRPQSPSADVPLCLLHVIEVESCPAAGSPVPCGGKFRRGGVGTHRRGWAGGEGEAAAFAKCQVPETGVQVSSPPFGTSRRSPHPVPPRHGEWWSGAGRGRCPFLSVRYLWGRAGGCAVGVVRPAPGRTERTTRAGASGRPARLCAGSEAGRGHPEPPVPSIFPSRPGCYGRVRSAPAARPWPPAPLPGYAGPVPGP